MKVVCANHQDAKFRVRLRRKASRLSIGFLPVNDCAPLVVAAEFNLFKKHGLSVELRRENSWADIRDKIVEGELHAGQAPGTLPFLTTLGVDCKPCSCTTSLVLSLQGNAITLSRQLWDQGIRDAASLRKQIHHDWGRKTYAFGVAFAHSSQSFLLRQWLADAGIVPGVEVRLVIVPPAELFQNLKLGYIDGYCVGEPWTTVAVDAGVGVCVGSSTFLAPMHPEKVLMVRQDFARQNSSEHEALVAALLEACALCDQPENRKPLAQLLAQAQYVNAPSDCLGSQAALDCNSKSREIRQWFGSDIFYRFKANDPTEEKAAWICNQLLHSLYGKHDRDGLHETAARLENVFQRQPFVAARRKALKYLKTIEAGDSNLQRLSQSGFWPNFRTVAGTHWRRFFKAFPDRHRLSEFTASSSEARTEAGAPYRSSALRLGERKDAFCSPDAAVAGTE